MTDILFGSYLEVKALQQALYVYFPKKLLLIEVIMGNVTGGA